MEDWLHVLNVRSISRIRRANWGPDVLVQQQHQPCVVWKGLGIFLIVNLGTIFLKHKVNLAPVSILQLLKSLKSSLVYYKRRQIIFIPTFSYQIFQTLCHDPFPDLPQPVGHFKGSLNHLLFGHHFQHSYEVIRALRAAGVTVAVYGLSAG